MATNGAYDLEKVRADFPILSRKVHGKPLVYLDNGASAQKPQVVIDAVAHAYSNEYANVHRGLHFLSNAATEAYEAARDKVRRFLNAPDAARAEIREEARQVSRERRTPSRATSRPRWLPCSMTSTAGLLGALGWQRRLGISTRLRTHDPQTRLAHRSSLESFDGRRCLWGRR